MSTLQKSCTLKQWSESSPWSRAIIISLLCLLLLLASLISLFVGATATSFTEIFDKGTTSHLIFMYIRLPRTIAALFAGAALAASGVLVQAALNNSLASPNIIGVNSGAGLGALLGAALLPSFAFSSQLGAFAGAILAGLLVFFIASKTGASRLTIILSGVAISSILSAGIDALTILDDDLALLSNSFLIGGFSGITYSKLYFPVGCIVLMLIILMPFGRELNLLYLGDESAMSLGMNVKRTRILLLISASVLAAAAVSFCGLLGFVGLLVPHIVRKAFGNDNRLVLPASALLGGVLVLLSDSLSRAVFAPYEFPVGIIMSLLGGPFFLYLLLKGKRRGRE